MKAYFLGGTPQIHVCIIKRQSVELYPRETQHIACYAFLNQAALVYTWTLAHVRLCVPSFDTLGREGYQRTFQGFQILLQVVQCLPTGYVPNLADLFQLALEYKQVFFDQGRTL